MKFVFFPMTLFIALCLLPNSGMAQLDSSYELLLGTSSHGGASDVSTRTLKAPKKKLRLPTNENSETNVQTPTSELPRTADGHPLPIKLQPDVSERTPQPEPSISEQAQSLFSASPEKVLGFYEENLDESDPRHNKIEINFAPTYVSNESVSSYSFRDYRSNFSAVNMGASVWLTPAIGVGGNFLFSLGADTSGDAVTGTNSPARQEFLDMALKFRKFFGFERTSKSLEFDVLYSDYKFNVNADDMYRAKLKSSGVGLKMKLRMPSSKEVAWSVGGSFFPKMQHSEMESGIDLRSGNNTENVRLGLHLGAEVTLSRDSQIFYEMSAASERNLFDGTASLVDPAKGLSPKNVSVTNTFYLFSLGYRWGN